MLASYYKSTYICLLIIFVMSKHFFKTFILMVIFLSPVILLAQPSFGSGVNDVTPIDQQTLLLASGGVIYAIHKLRERRKK